MPAPVGSVASRHSMLPESNSQEIDTGSDELDDFPCGVYPAGADVMRESGLKPSSPLAASTTAAISCACKGGGGPGEVVCTWKQNQITEVLSDTVSSFFASHRHERHTVFG